MDYIFDKPVIDIVETGKNIRNLRIKSGISVRTLQNIFSFSYPQAIYNWEHGVDIPKIDNLLVLAQLFDVRVEDLIVTRSVSVELGESESELIKKYA